MKSLSLLVGCLLFGAAPAFGQSAPAEPETPQSAPAEPEAERRLREATTAAEVRAALALAKADFTRDGDPASLYRIALSYRMLGHDALAMGALKELLRLAPEGTSLRADAEEAAITLELELLDASANPTGAEIPVECPDEVASREGSGRCCWPGQTWSEAAGACEGAPTCPGDHSPRGELCLPNRPPQATGAAAPTAVKFVVPSDKDAFEIAVKSAQGALRCEAKVSKAAPCSLPLPPGEATITVKDRRESTHAVTIPEGAEVFSIRKGRHNGVKVGAGLFLIGGGLVTLGALAAPGFEPDPNAEDQLTPGAVIATGAILGVIGSIALTVSLVRNPHGVELKSSQPPLE